MLEVVANTLISALERKHPYTRGHSERVGRYSKNLAIAAKKNYPWLTDENIHLILIGGRLHDIGKICVERATLNNPGHVLTPDQIQELEDHPYHGVEILRKCGTDIPRIVYDCVLYHHERFDGLHNNHLMGYPLGIAGNDIPLSARIVSVADIYDALRSARPYKEPMSIEEADNTLRTMSGNKLDPKLVEIFLPLPEREIT